MALDIFSTTVEHKNPDSTLDSVGGVIYYGLQFRNHQIVTYRLYIGFKGKLGDIALLTIADEIIQIKEV